MPKKNFLKKIKINFGKASAILIAVFVVLLTADLVLKYCEEFYNWRFTVIPKFIWVEYGSHNTGAAFSFLADTEWGRIFFIVLTFIMLIVMIFSFLILPERMVILKLCLTMVTAGALGNLVDRLAFGYVRDFVWMNIFGSYACCNFADFWIVLGVILAVLDMLFLNEWAAFPLTKRAKAAAKARAEAVAREKAEEQENKTELENKENPQPDEKGEEADGDMKGQPPETPQGGGQSGDGEV